MSSIINSYASAILGCVSTIEDAMAVMDDLSVIQDFLGCLQDKLRKIILSKSTARKIKLNLWQEIYKGLSEKMGAIRPEVDAVIKLLIENKRLNILHMIVARGKAQLLDRQNITECFITLPPQVSEEYKKKLTDVLKKQFTNKLQLKFLTDSSLVAGFIVKIDSKILDLSFKAKVERLKANILKNK